MAGFDANLQDFLVQLSFKEALLTEYLAQKTDADKRTFLINKRGLSEAAADAIIGNQDIEIKALAGINQNNNP